MPTFAPSFDERLNHRKPYHMRNIIAQLALISSLATTAMAQDVIDINYQQDRATVSIPAALKKSVKQQVKGAHVTLLADKAYNKELTLRLAGKSTNGSLYMDGKCPLALVFNGLDLTNPDSCAVNIQDGKLTKVKLADGTKNALADGNKTKAQGQGDAHKAALFLHGHAEWSGKGAMTLTGNVGHGYASDEYTLFLSGALTVKRAAKDAMRVKQYLHVKGGQLALTGKQGGIDVDKTKDPKDERNGQVVIEGGQLSATATGSASYDKKKKKIVGTAALACDLFTMKGGQVSLLHKGAGGRGLKADEGVNVSGGQLSVVTQGEKYEYNDALDAKPHGIKSDKDITLSGGVITVKVAAKKATTLKTDGKISTKGAQVATSGGKPWK